MSPLLTNNGLFCNTFCLFKDGFISAPVIEIYVSFINSNVGPTNVISKTAELLSFPKSKFANLALVSNLFLLIGILTLFEATLTLPGIAGIILTVGMAVDANVLIYERIKEEIKSESNKIVAFDSGYVKSKTTILDANITTLIAALILFILGSGPVKGFAVTLGVGIFTTLFSVYFIARLFTSIYVSRNKDKEKLI